MHIMTNKKNIEVKLKRKLKEQNKDKKGLLWGENYRRKFWSFFYVYCCQVGVPGDQDFSPPFPWIDVSRKQGFWCAKYLDFPCKIMVFKVMISQF
jgi:hypothetical protein